MLSSFYQPTPLLVDKMEVNQPLAELVTAMSTQVPKGLKQRYLDR
jgi:hypothetical protein